MMARRFGILVVAGVLAVTAAQSSARAVNSDDGPRLLDAVLTAEEAASLGGISGSMAPSTWSPSCQTDPTSLSCQKGYYPTAQGQVFPGAFVLEVHATGRDARSRFDGWTLGDRSSAVAREIATSDPDRRLFYLDEPSFTRVESYAVRGRLLVRVRCAGESGTAAEPLAACANRSLDAQLAKVERSFPSVVPPSSPMNSYAQAFRDTATVSWSPPANDGGASTVEYVVTSVPASAGCRTTETTCAIRGLSVGTDYAFSVAAANPAGSSAAVPIPQTVRVSLPSGPVRAVRVARAGSSFRVSWKPPTRLGGATVLRYEVRSTPSGARCETRTTSCTVTGLTPGRQYRFTVVARNAAGASPAVASRSVRAPARTPAPVPIPSPPPTPEPAKPTADVS